MMSNVERVTGISKDGHHPYSFQLRSSTAFITVTKELNSLKLNATNVVVDEIK